MIDIKQSLVTTLDTAVAIPVYYDLFYKPGVIPCVTYIEIDDSSLLDGDTLRYSTLRYQIKIYAKTMADIVTNAGLIDTALFNAGWRRYSSIETNDDNYIIKVIRYVATGYEEVN